MCDVLMRVEAGGLDDWADPDLKAALLGIEAVRGRVDAAQACVLAELVRRGRAPETMFGSTLSPHEALRRRKIAVALSDGSLPGAAEALAAGDATHAHVAALAEVNDRLPPGAAEKLLGRAKDLSPDKFRRAAHREANPIT